ncbi:hypothetical protein vBAcoSR7M_28 [Alteromonas phage vB_AcoS-R7M]|uniref:PKD/Chitinase domain-containing protein n=1 Tax=Alteromonas phage vB_AcoS-R7M TaxID=2729541 RepID=A0A6M3YNF0_9CAUD|nr:hypothetical protein HWD34_gp28 [Alteromonas phage vB_AcoS-R7M]QJI53350.1 hypothetical protein vBAcoSR7M_28 [Alteromonas phage vB_AcoS-R7M]
MAVTTLDLVQTNGTPLPSELTVLEGEVEYNGSGLVAATAPAALNFNHKDTAIVSYTIVDTALSDDLVVLQYRYTNDGSVTSVTIYYNFAISRLTTVETIAGENIYRRDTFLSDYNFGDMVKISVVPANDLITIYINGVRVYGYETELNKGVASSTIKLNGTAPVLTELEYTDSNEGNSDIQSPLAALPLSLIGKSTQFQKLGIMHNKPSTMSFVREFWAETVDTSMFPGWPTTRYPRARFSCTDHDTGSGGIWVRVYDKDLGAITDPSSWLEWDDVSSRPEFDHIERKINPVFVYSGTGDQTETPMHLVAADGDILMYFHNSTVTLEGFPAGIQATHYATTLNGIDYTDPTPSSIVYDPTYLEGDGHTGYFQPGRNTFAEIPYKYIGIHLHGGAGASRGSCWAIEVSNDGKNWERWRTFMRDFQATKRLPYTDEEDKFFVLQRVHEAKRVGGYYRVWGRWQREAFGGRLGELEAVEVLVDSDFNIVSECNVFIPRGSEGEFDAVEIRGYFPFEYGGVEYATYSTRLGTTIDDESAIGIGIVTDVNRNWQIYNGMANKSRTLLVDRSNFPEKVSSSETIVLKTEAGYQYQSLPIRRDNSISTLISNDPVDLSGQITDVTFKNIGKDSAAPIYLEFGITDSLSNPTQQLSISFDTDHDVVTGCIPMLMRIIGTVGTQEVRSINVFGMDNDNPSVYETANTKHELTIRIDKHNNEIQFLSGGSVTDTLPLAGFVADTPMFVFIKAGTIDPDETEDSSVSFNEISVQSATADKLVELVNAHPIADAGPDQSGISAGSTFQLDGSGSYDSDGSIVGYEWVQVDNGAPSVAPFDTTAVQPMVTAPSIGTPTTLRFELVVEDDDGAFSVADAVNVEVTSTPNVGPTANAGTPSTIEAGSQYQLNGSASDSDGTIVSTVWTQTGDAVTLSNPNVLNPTFTAPLVSSGSTTFTLTVTDDDGETATDTVVITYEDTTAPVITRNGPATVTLNLNDTFTPATFTAFDAVDGDLTSAITVVNPYQPATGEYTVTANVSDAAGNAATEVTQVVTVTDDISYPFNTVSSENIPFGNNVVLQTTIRLGSTRCFNVNLSSWCNPEELYSHQIDVSGTGLSIVNSQIQGGILVFYAQGLAVGRHKFKITYSTQSRQDYFYAYVEVSSYEGL